MKSLNVRLAPADAKALRKLKANGDNISEIVRQTLHERAATTPAKKSRLTQKVVDELLAKVDALQNGEPVPEYVRLGVDPAVRQQAAAYMRLRLAKRLDGSFR